jgi:hypothetical protein
LRVARREQYRASDFTPAMEANGGSRVHGRHGKRRR